MAEPEDRANQKPGIMRFLGQSEETGYLDDRYGSPGQHRENIHAPSQEELSDDDDMARVEDMLNDIAIGQKVKTLRLAVLATIEAAAVAVAILVPMSETNLAFLLFLILMLAWWCISEAEGVLTVGMNLRRLRSLVADFPEGTGDGHEA